MHKTPPPALNLQPWAVKTDQAFTLRGWHTPPTGKPVIHFIHGNSFCGRVYEPMLAHLAVDFDLWLSDVQGHGDSDLGGRFKGWNVSAELAVKAFQAHRNKLFGQAPVMAVGHSFGGVLSCLAMAEHPKLFTRAGPCHLLSSHRAGHDRGRARRHGGSHAARAGCTQAPLTLARPTHGH